VIGFAVCLPLVGAGFRASAVRVDSTPQKSQWLLGYEARQSTGVHDNIYYRVVAMDSGDTQYYLISIRGVTSVCACGRSLAYARGSECASEPRP
jgi:hypothetical protein